MAKETKKRVAQETTANPHEIGGFGTNVVKLTDSTSGEVLCYIGMQGGEEKVCFSKAVSPEQVEAVNDLLNRKKLHRHIENERFDKAQKYADRKFSG